MPSINPFPGMNPFLERSWRDFHGQLITAIRAELNRCLPDDLFARIEEDVYVVDREEERLSPDVSVVETLNPTDTPGSTSTAL